MDVVIYCIYFVNKIGVDFDEIVMKKLELMKVKYLVELVKGCMMKYIKFFEVLE